MQKRNEFEQEGKRYLGLGGSVNLDNPSDYSQIAKKFIERPGYQP